MIALVAAFLSRAASTVRTVLGAPDYARYLDHMRQAHPNDRVMSETEFDVTKLDDRYNRPGSRCC